MTASPVSTDTSVSQTPTPAATLTRAEEIYLETRLDNPQSAASPDGCDEVLETQDWCNVVTDVVQIFRPEWEQLLPRTEFYLEKYDLYGGEFVQKKGLLIIEQDGQRYTPETYDFLLEANDIVVTNENRELVAMTWALTTIPDYLVNEVVFSKWEAVDIPNALHNFNYCLDGWAKVRAFRRDGVMYFNETQLKVASGPGMLQFQVGVT